jgi:hypothetical protein
MKTENNDLRRLHFGAFHSSSKQQNALSMEISLPHLEQEMWQIWGIAELPYFSVMCLFLLQDFSFLAFSCFMIAFTPTVNHLPSSNKSKPNALPWFDRILDSFLENDVHLLNGLCAFFLGFAYQVYPGKFLF